MKSRPESTQEYTTRVKQLVLLVNNLGFKNMSITASIDEQAVVQLLNMGAKQGLYVFLGIICYLLEFIYVKDTRFIGLLQIQEYLFQSQLRSVDITQFDIESRRIKRKAGFPFAFLSTFRIFDLRS